MNRKKASLIVTLIVVAGTLYFGWAILSKGVRAGTLYVGGGGPGNYTTIQEAIDASNPGDVIYVYNGSYHEIVHISKPLSLVGEDRNTTTIDAGRLSHVVYVTADFVNITGFTIRNSTNDFDIAGIKVRAHNCYIADNIVVDHWEGIRLISSENNTLFGNTISRNLYGIHLVNSHNNSIVGNTASPDHWIDVSLEFGRGNRIINNTFSGSSSGVSSYSSVNNTLTDNMMIGTGVALGGSGVEHWNTHDIDISNTVNGKPVYYWKNAVGGTVPLDAGQVILANSTGVIVENQNLSGTSVGIQLGFSSGNILMNNTVSSSSLGGIHLEYSANNVVENSTLLFNEWGIRLGWSHNNTIANSSAKDNTLGFYPFDSNDNTISNNKAINNRIGMALVSCQGNEIKNNTLMNNENGIDLFTSDSNKIYHNNMVDNIDQAIDNQANSWNSGYPSGGNYWSDYAGIDNKSGPNQDLPGSDDIGDTPYVIDSDSIDYYPLMFPVGPIPTRPPILLEATLTGADSENVTLAWSLSPDDGSGFKSVVGYRVYRNMTYDIGGLGYGLVATLPNGTSEYMDIHSGEGDPNNYFYRICAEDTAGNISCARNQAGKFTRTLSEGTNLVSTPLIQSNESIEAVLQTLKWDKAWSYDSSIQEWKWHMKFKPYTGELMTVNHTMGLWVNVTQDANLTIAGFVPETTQIQLRTGWNLVGYPSFQQDYQVTDLKADVSADRVERFYPFWPPYYLRALEDFEVLMAGYGYWIKVRSDTTWTVNNT